MKKLEIIKDRKDAIKKLNKIKVDLDTEDGFYDEEAAHLDADDVLCNLLDSLGCSDVVEAYCKIEKWYG